MLASQGYGQGGAIASQGYAAFPIGLLVELELREIQVEFIKTQGIKTAFIVDNALRTTFEKAIESVLGTIPPGSPPIPTDTVEIRQLTGTFTKAQGLVAEFKIQGNITTIFEKIIESHLGDIPVGTPPTPTPTVEIRQLAGTFEKANTIVVQFNKKGELQAIFTKFIEESP